MNSFHHQAIDALGRGLRAVAWARRRGRSRPSRPPTRDFLFGVQWHAESLVDRPEHLALFEGLVEAAAPARPPVEERRRELAPGAGPRGRPGRRAYTLGVEEEVMLLDPHDWSLAQQIDDVLPRARRRARART